MAMAMAMVMASTRERDRELLIPVGEALEQDDASSASTSPSVACPPSSSHLHHSPGGVGAFSKFIRSWASKKFMTGCVILLPIAITFYTTWWFIHFVDGFFSPIYIHLGINVFAKRRGISPEMICFSAAWHVIRVKNWQLISQQGDFTGLGFITSITFIFLVGVFMSSWLGASVLGLGEWFIKKMPLVSYIYSASKQISTAISPDQSSRAFKEVAILRHPRVGEYAIGFITSTVVLRKSSGDEELYCVYIPTNHLYLGDIFLISSKDVIKPNLSVREGIEIVISGGMSIPQILSTVEVKPLIVDHVRVLRSPKYASAHD